MKFLLDGSAHFQAHDGKRRVTADNFDEAHGNEITDEMSGEFRARIAVELGHDGDQRVVT